MLFRKIDNVIRHHYATEQKAIFLTGARQVGKSYAIEKYARSHYGLFVECNFYKEPELIELVQGAKDEKDLLSKLALYKNMSFSDGDTFIFFDEIQRCPDIMTWVKFLVQDGRYRYALSGSLLGIELKGVRSMPVGYVSEHQVYPLDFEEFLIAIGVGAEWIDRLRECYEQRREVDSFVHKKMMEIYHLYLVVGGMPAAVQKYVDTHDLVQVIDEQKAILALYKRDISIYNTGRELQINEIFDLIPSELNAQNKRFVFKDLHDKARFDDHRDDFLWLKQADMALPTYNVDTPIYPLKMGEKRNLFKLFQNDVGLLCCQYANGVQLKLIQGDVTLNYGAIYENAVAQELHAHGWNLYYFSSKKQGELDFLLERDADIIPVEVKSGKTYDRHRALNNILDNPEYTLIEPVVLTNDNVKQCDRLLYLPIYMLMFLQHNLQPQSAQIYIPNLEGFAHSGK